MDQNGQITLDWAKHEGEILDLFVGQGKTLNEVIAHMRKKHNFEARYTSHPILSYLIMNLTTQNLARGSIKPGSQSLKT